MQISGVVTDLESVLGEFVSTEVRLGISVGVVLIAVGAAGLVIPRLIEQSRRLTADVTRNRFGGRVADGVDLVEEMVPIPQILTLIVRVVQLLMLLLTVVALLVVWGLTDFAFVLIGLIESSVQPLTRLAITAGLVIAAGLANNVLQDVISDFTTGTDHVTAHQEQILTRVAQVVLIVVATISVLSVWNINLGGLLVGAGFLGIIVGMAARQTLGSLIAGFVLMFSRPFEIGDWIAVGDNEGIVTKITIMNTHIRNFDGEHVVVPNDSVNQQAVINRSRDGKLRVHVSVGVDYDADPNHAAEIAEEAIKEVNFIDGNPPPQVIPVGFGGSSVDLDVRFWISPPSPQRRGQAIADVIETIKERFDTESIGIPYPHRTLDYRDGGEERPADHRASMEAVND